MKLTIEQKAALEALEGRIKGSMTPGKAQIDAMKSLVKQEIEPVIDRIERISIIQPKDGARGEKGERGPKGADGINGKDGKDGKDGNDGRPGKDGKNGVSIIDADIAADDHLVFKLSNGNIIDVGELPSSNSAGGSIHVSGNAWQITVSDTAPDNPALYELWYDIS